MPDLTPNIKAAYEEELRGLEARLVRADDTQRATLEPRIATIRATLGEPAPTPSKTKRAGTVKETRPDPGAGEARG